MKPIGPGVGQPGSAGSPPVIRPMTVQGQRAPTPFYWGPTVGTYTPRRDGIIPGPYTPMGVPAVLIQPPRYAPPGSPDRQQNPLAQGPRPGAIAGDYPILNPVPNAPPPATPPRLDRDPITHQRDLIIRIRDGIFVRGRIEGDKYRIGFTIGGHPFLIDRFGFAHDTNRGGYCFRGYGSWGAAYPYYYNYGYGYWHSPVYGVLATIDPATADPFLTQPMNPAGTPAPAAPAIDESVLPNVERGHLALQRGQAADAVAFYRAHVAVESGDADTLRYLAVALFEAREFPEAAAVMILAYSTDPDLAGLPMIASRFPQGERGLADRVTRATGVANSSRTASAYLFAAVLAQADGRPDVASRLLNRSRAAGLHRQIDAAFARTLNPPAPPAPAPRAPAR